MQRETGDGMLYKFIKNLSGLTAAVVAGGAVAVGADPSFAYSALALVATLLATQSAAEERDQSTDRRKLAARLAELFKTNDDLLSVVRRLAEGQEAVAEFDRARAGEVLESLSAGEQRLRELQESRHSATIYAANWLAEQHQQLGDRLEAEIDRLGKAIEAHAEESRENHALTHAGLAAANASIADLKETLDELLADKQAGETSPGARATPEQLAAVDELLRRGEAKERAKAALVKRDFKAHRKYLAEAMKLVIGEAVELLTLQGDGFYYQQMFDEAVEPYEQAWRHRPDDFVTRNNLALALSQTQRRPRAADRQRAIELYTESLKQLPAGTPRWAGTQNNLGEAWREIPIGDRGENLRNAIDCYQRALEVWTAEAFPHYHAMAMENLARAREMLAALDGP